MKRPAFLRYSLVLLSVPAVVLAVAACDTGPSAGQATTKTAPETNNGEAASRTYVDARYHYRIDAPGAVTASADGSAGFVGPTERIQIVVKTGSIPGQAAADSKSLPSSLTDFQLKSGPNAVTLNGRQVDKFVYTFSAGTNAVTGKPLSLVGVRYYIPKDPSTFAVITYGIAADQYDPQGADDIASTFQWQ
jgi:hypothetical protein